MNKHEVIKILSLLTAYYGKSKAEADIMVNAWYILLKDYDYAIAEQAVIEYAKNDHREYSQFPQIGAVIQSIKDEQKSITAIRNFAYYGKEYDELPERSKKWINKERFERLKKCPDEYLLENMEQIRNTLCRGLLTEREKND